MIIALRVITEVYCFSSRYILKICCILLLVSKGMNSKSCHIDLFWFKYGLRRLTDLIGSTTIAIKGSHPFWKSYWVLTSIPDSQHPKLGWEWYHPTIWWVLILLFHYVYASSNDSYPQLKYLFSHLLWLLFMKIRLADKSHPRS